MCKCAYFYIENRLIFKFRYSGYKTKFERVNSRFLYFYKKQLRNNTHYPGTKCL